MAPYRREQDLLINRPIHAGTNNAVIHKRSTFLGDEPRLSKSQYMRRHVNQ